ncbi:trypsin-like serine peptidase, partial [Staphylococcus felis]
VRFFSPTFGVHIKMRVNFLNKLIAASSIFTILVSTVGIFESYSYAKDYNESEIMQKQEAFKVPPFDSELFSKVDDTTKSPYSSVGTVFVKGQTLASGVLIGKNTVITNYHIARLANKNPSNIIFTPGSTRDEGSVEVKTPYGQFEAEDINESPYGQGTDLAIIKLKTNKNGESAGDLVPPAKIPDNIDLQSGDKINLLGYPYNYSTHTLYRSEIEIFDLESGAYFGYTEPGNSGSGIFNLQGELVGIHVGKGGQHNLPIGKFFNGPLGSLYTVDNTLSTIGNDLKKRAKLQE